MCGAPAGLNFKTAQNTYITDTYRMDRVRLQKMPHRN